KTGKLTPARAVQMLQVAENMAQATYWDLKAKGYPDEQAREKALNEAKIFYLKSQAEAEGRSNIAEPLITLSQPTTSALGLPPGTSMPPRYAVTAGSNAYRIRTAKEIDAERERRRNARGSGRSGGSTVAGKGKGAKGVPKGGKKGGSPIPKYTKATEEMIRGASEYSLKKNPETVRKTAESILLGIMKGIIKRNGKPIPYEEIPFYIENRIREFVGKPK
ncbi:MAG: hypothetical protein AAB449_02555, partial [Patescibacteria group bacterium]